MANRNLKLIEATHPLTPLFPTLTPTEIDKLITLVKSGEMPPLVGRLSESQRAMFAANLITHVSSGRGGNTRTPPGETNLTTAAGFLGVHVNTVQMARMVLAEGTPDEIARVYAGGLPVAVGRDILDGLTPEQRAIKRPHDSKRAPTRRPSVLAERILARMAEDEEKRAHKLELARLRREKAKAKLTSPAAAPPDDPLPLVNMVNVLVKAAQHIPVAEAAAVLNPHITQAQIETLIEWLIDISYKPAASATPKEPTP